MKVVYLASMSSGLVVPFDDYEIQVVKMQLNLRDCGEIIVGIGGRVVLVH